MKSFRNTREAFDASNDVIILTLASIEQDEFARNTYYYNILYR